MWYYKDWKKFVPIIIVIFCSILPLSDGEISAICYNHYDYKPGEFPYNLLQFSNTFITLKQNKTGLEPFSGQPLAEFRLFTKPNTNKYEVISTGSINCKSSFNRNKDTTFIIHGWLQSTSSPDMLDLKEAILSKYKDNVILVDWSELASKVYNVSRFRIDDVATAIYNIIKYIKDTLGQPLSRIRIVGFSLGAQIAGLAGKRLEGSISNIIGLDPAGPFFSPWNTADRLNIGDAQYVQILHTGGGNLGLMEPIGDFDIYANGGRNQLSCNGVDYNCSHFLAMPYFTNSVKNPNVYSSYECASYLQIVAGLCVPTGKQGPFIELKPSVKSYGVYWSDIQG